MEGDWGRGREGRTAVVREGRMVEARGEEPKKEKGTKGREVIEKMERREKEEEASEASTSTRTMSACSELRLLLRHYSRTRRRGRGRGGAERAGRKDGVCFTRLAEEER